MSERCPRCGTSSFFGDLCQQCRAYDAQMLNAAEETAAAALATADAELARQLRLEEQAERKERREQKREIKKIAERFIQAPAFFEAKLDKAQSSESLRRLLASVANNLAGTPLERWLVLSRQGGHSFEVAYEELRCLIVPAILRLWNDRKSLSPSPEAMLRTLAFSFVYPDLQVARAAYERLTVMANAADAKARSAKWKGTQADEQDQRCLACTLKSYGAIAGIVVGSWLLWSFLSWAVWILVVLVLAGAAFYFRQAATACRINAEARRREQTAEGSLAEQSRSEEVGAKQALLQLRDPRLVALCGAQPPG